MARTAKPAAHRADTSSQAQRSIRRKLGLTIAFGALVTLGGPSAEAADGDPVILGASNTASSQTTIQTTSSYGLVASSSDPASYAQGIQGSNSGGGDGVGGYSDHANGVFGWSQAPQASGVHGENRFGGYGVAGVVLGRRGGVAVLADSPRANGSVALRTTGKLQFWNRSGIAKVAPRHRVTSVKLPGVTHASWIIATVQQSGGYVVTAAIPAGGKFRIVLNRAAQAGTPVKVAYLVLN